MRQGWLLAALLGASILLLTPHRSLAQAGSVPPPELWSVDSWEPADHFSSEQLEGWRAEALQRRALAVSGTVLGLAFYFVFLIGPLGPALWRRSEALAARIGRRQPSRWLDRVLTRVFGRDWAAAGLFTAGYVATGAVVSLPLWIGAELVEQRAGLSRYGLLEWVFDLIKGELALLFGLGLLVFGLFGLVRRMPRRWWLAVGLPAGAFLILQAMAAPLSTRLDHEVVPLADPGLRRRLSRLVESEGLRLSSVRVIRASETTARLGAQLTGLGPTRELLLFDTLLEAVDDDAVAVAVAHELGHARRSWTSLRLGAAALGLLVMLRLVAFALSRGPRWFGFTGPGDVRALPLVMLVTSLCFLAARPARLALSRAEERAADRAALTMTSDPEAFVELQLALAETNRADLCPTSLELWWFAAHPPIGERIGQALWYRRWLDRTRGQRG